MQKRLLFLSIALSLAFGVLGGFSSNISSVTASSKPKKTFVKPEHTKKNAKRVFLNSSKNDNGHTTILAKKLFGNQSYRQINLADYNIPQVGQGNGDFNKIWTQLKDADVIVIGTPVYWSNMSGYLKTFIDHLEINNDLKGSDLYMIVQGADSNQTLAINSTYGTMNRVAVRFGLNFVGIAQNANQVKNLHNKMIGK